MIKIESIKKIKNKSKAIQRRLGMIYDINIQIDTLVAMGEYDKVKALQYKSKVLEWELELLKQEKVRPITKGGMKIAKLG